MLLFVAKIAIFFGVDLNLVFDPVHYVRLKVQRRVALEHPQVVARKARKSEN